MPYRERDLHPYVKMIVEEEGRIDTTNLNLRLREILDLDAEDLRILDNRNDDKFSQIVRNLVRYTPDENGIVRKNGYLIDKNYSPAVFYALRYNKQKEDINEPIDDIEIEQRINKKRRYIARKVDFQKVYEENMLLGDAGERYALDYERNRIRILDPSLDVLEEVLQTSKVYGDGAGYDILSKNIDNGSPLFIEVKTTKGDYKTPFYISMNELSFLEEYKENALIYRVHDFDYLKNTGRITTISYDQLIQYFYLDPITYKATPKANY